MKLHDLKIRNIRGIRELDLAFNGQAAVIYGDNGTGKSAVVDAIDFLLTGDIQRLTGRRGASLRDHGRHVSAALQDAHVEATVSIPGHEAAISIRRTFAQPNLLECPNNAREVIDRYAAVAAQRQYMLTRNGVLAFITAVPKTRAEMVQTILNLERVEDTRAAIVRAVGSARNTHAAHRASRLSAEGQLATSLGLTTFALASALAAVNRFRETLGGAPVQTIADAKRDLLPPHSTGAATTPSPLADVELVGRSVRPDQQTAIDAMDGQLRRSLATLRNNAESLEAAQRVDFLERALFVVEGAVACPLCDTTWPPDHLKTTVQEKLERARPLLEPLRQLREAADSLLRWIGGHLEAVERLLALPAGTLPEATVDLMRQYGAALRTIKTELSDPLNVPPLLPGAPALMSVRLGLPAIYDNLRALYRELAARARIDPRQAAWDALTRAEENWQTLTRCAAAEAASKALADSAESLRAGFIRARDEVLTALYNSVRDRFVALYRQIHAPDEATFTADIRPTEAGLELEVNFYGLINAAPFALHSEGHQDSMGLCLFLALSERVDAASLGFRVLDDVLMSVDSGHRMGVARLLTQLSTQLQFVITTHDQTWAKQLQTCGCVRSRNCTRILSWSVQAGPIVKFDADFLDDAYASLARHDVPGAAHDLRRGLEGFFQFAADSLRAKVPFSLSGQYDLGQVSSACTGRLKDLIRKARAAANSWGQTALVATLGQTEAAQAAAFVAANVEQWAINVNVHFNQWATMNETEFRRVVDAFTAVRDLFMCPTCRCLLEAVFEGPNEVTVKCPCNGVAWNLTPQ